MNIQVTLRGMDSSPVIEEYIGSSIEKVTRLLKRETSPISIEIVLEAARKHHHHRAEIILKSPHYDLFSHFECPEMYLAIDKAVDRMVHEVTKAKEKRIDLRKHSNTFKGA
ncbi:ribosome-associated translation inhibitor RaiA [bacterium]|jgi:ribosomal subunit interface protein|nr:ribosome-associated translation inhibitor RaiA [bacterium]